MQNQDVLVPIDFSDGSLRAIEFAVSVAEPEGAVYVLHVVDADFVARVAEEGFGTPEDLGNRLRERAEEQMRPIAQAHAALGSRFATMVATGKPFAEILKLSRDMDFDMIVLARQGRRMADLEALLFGSTADKVLRGSAIPVLVVPGAVAERPAGSTTRPVPPDAEESTS